MGDLAKKAKDMKEQMKGIQNELKELRIETDENGVKIVMTGEMECVSIEIKENKLLTEPNKEKTRKILYKSIQQSLSTSKICCIFKIISRI